MSDVINIEVKVTAKSPTNKIVGWREGQLIVRVSAPREKGKANLELIRFLNKCLSIPQANIIILKGETSPLKTIRFEGFTKQSFEQAILNVVCGAST